MALSRRLLVLALLLAGSSQARALDALSAEEKALCSSIARSGFRSWRTADLSKLPAPSAGFELELPLNIVVLNHKGFWSAPSGEDEIAFHLQEAREVYRQCGVEVVVDSLRYIEGPEFLQTLDRGADNGEELTDRERCLLGPLKKTNVTGVFFVDGVDSAKGSSTSHALGPRTLANGEYSREADKTFAGNVFITDGSRASMGDSRKRRMVFAHEIGHVVMDTNEVRERGNLMSSDLEDMAPRLTEPQCAAVRRGPYVRKRR